MQLARSVRLNALRLMVLAGLAAVAFSSGCAAVTVPFKGSYRAVDETPLTEGTIVALDTGETVDLNEILKLEGNKRPEKILVLKTHGLYAVVADGFKHLYLLEHNSKDEADGDAVDLEVAPEGATETKFRAGVASLCGTLTYKGLGGEKKVYIGRKGKTSNTECPDGATPIVAGNSTAGETK